MPHFGRASRTALSTPPGGPDIAPPTAGCKTFGPFLRFRLSHLQKSHAPRDRGFVAETSKEHLPSRHLQATIRMTNQTIKQKASFMSDTEIAEDHRPANPVWPGSCPLAALPSGRVTPAPAATAAIVSFGRQELRQIFDLYGRKVAAGEWRDYAIDFTSQKAVFSIYRRASEYALYRIEKNPKLARKQGLYCVVTATGLILKRGPDLARVIAVLDTRLKLVSG
jgi:Protein of unknown function (DUF2794)